MDRNFLLALALSMLVFTFWASYQARNRPEGAEGDAKNLQSTSAEAVPGQPAGRPPGATPPTLPPAAIPGASSPSTGGTSAAAEGAVPAPGAPAVPSE